MRDRPTQADSMPATDRITTHAIDEPVRIYWGETLLADSEMALELAETGYPPRLYIPMADVATDWLCVSDTTTHCPYKGDATYYHVHVDGEQLDDAAWCYAEPITAVEAIRGHVAFDDAALVVERG